MKTLAQIIENESKRRHEDGDFGIAACKESIIDRVQRTGESLYTILESYVDRANKDIFFNSAMVLACYELINER